MTRAASAPAAVLPMTQQEWWAEATRRFGSDRREWAFVCPACGHVARVAEWQKLGAPIGTVAFSCIGRFLPHAREAFAAGPGPCTYAGGGLIGLNPVSVIAPDGTVHRVFAFAEAA